MTFWGGGKSRGPNLPSTFHPRRRCPLGFFGPSSIPLLPLGSRPNHCHPDARLGPLSKLRCLPFDDRADISRVVGAWMHDRHPDRCDWRTDDAVRLTAAWCGQYGSFIPAARAPSVAGHPRSREEARHLDDDSAGRRITSRNRALFARRPKQKRVLPGRAKPAAPGTRVVLALGLALDPNPTRLPPALPRPSSAAPSQCRPILISRRKPAVGTVPATS